MKKPVRKNKPGWYVYNVQMMYLLDPFMSLKKIVRAVLSGGQCKPAASIVMLNKSPAAGLLLIEGPVRVIPLLALN